MPAKGTSLEFNKFYRNMRIPFVVYVDFESLIKPIDTCQSDPISPFTINIPLSKYIYLPTLSTIIIHQTHCLDRVTPMQYKLPVNYRSILPRKAHDHSLSGVIQTDT